MLEGFWMLADYFHFLFIFFWRKCFEFKEIIMIFGFLFLFPNRCGIYLWGSIFFS